MNFNLEHVRVRHPGELAWIAAHTAGSQSAQIPRRGFLVISGSDSRTFANGYLRLSG